MNHTARETQCQHLPVWIGGNEENVSYGAQCPDDSHSNREPL